MLTAAKISLNVKSKPKSKRSKTKKWFNVECKKLRKKFHALSNRKNKNPSNIEPREKSNEALKLYKTFCNRNRKELWTEKVNYLYDVDPNTTNMWNVWKSCNEEFQPRSPPLEDDDIWKNYCQHLFENETNKHDSSSTWRPNKNIKLNTHKLSESEPVKLNMPSKN